MPLPSTHPAAAPAAAPTAAMVMLLSAALSACAVGPTYHPAAAGLTPTFTAQPSLAPADAQWWTRFEDPLLDRLVEQALAQNLDVAAASARIATARATAGAASAALLPRLDANADAEADRQSLDTPFGAAAHQLGFRRNYELYQVGTQASWEVDLFGGLARQRQAARAELAGAMAAAAAVRLSVVAETVDAYLQLRGLQARLQVAQAQERVEGNLVELIRQREAQGLSAHRDLARSSGEMAGVAASIPPLRAAIVGQIDRIDVLTGRQAGASRGELAVAAAIPAPPQPSGSAVPAELMRRRPDVVLAESRVIAANARIGAALSEYYPHLSFAGALGFASVGGVSLLGGDALQANGGAALRWRLFDFGRVDAEVKQARGREAEALAQYRSALLQATADVETALAALAESRTEVAARERQVAQLGNARDLTQQAYSGGVVALLDVLDADRALLDASDRLAQARAQAARASLATTRALGGGYSQGREDHG